MDGKMYLQTAKDLSKEVRELEKERNYIRSYDHKIKLIDAKKKRLKMKDLDWIEEFGGGVESFGSIR